MTNASDRFRNSVSWYMVGRREPYVRKVPHLTDTFGVIEVAKPAGESAHPGVPRLVVGQVLSSGRFGRCDFGAGILKDRTFEAGEFTVIPVNAPTRLVVEDRHVVRAFELPLDVLRPVFEEENGVSDPFDLGQLHTSSVANQRVSILLDHLWDEAAGGHLVGRLAAESVIITVGVALLRAKQRGRQKSIRPTPRPSDWRLRQTMERMEAHLDGDIGLAEMAAAVDLSPAHLASLFHAAVGVPPYQWLLRLRIERARALLADPRRSITDIAAACGFGSSQYFATAFRKHMGCSPTTYRRERLR